MSEERCEMCDRPRAADADRQNMGDHPLACRCERCVRICWLTESTQCRLLAVDWRARAKEEAQRALTAEAALAEARQQVSNLTADRDRLTRERDEARAERDSLAADRATVEWRIAEYMGERNEARAGRDAALKAEDILVGLLNSVTDQRDELRADRDRLVGEVERANEKLAAWAGEVAKLSADKHALRAVVDAADKQNDAYKVMDASRPATGDGGSESFWREHDAYLAACDDTCAAVYEWRRNTGEKKT